MAIKLVPAPSAAPLSTTDYVAQNNLIYALLRQNSESEPISGGNVVLGSVFNIGGAMYLTDADTAITGTQSNFVKLTPSGDKLTCAASYVANLTGVAWNKTYGGYYDASGNLYVFDEAKAIYDGVLTVANTKLGKLANIKTLNVGALAAASAAISGNAQVGSINGVQPMPRFNDQAAPGQTVTLPISAAYSGGGSTFNYSATVPAGTYMILFRKPHRESSESYNMDMQPGIYHAFITGDGTSKLIFQAPGRSGFPQNVTNMEYTCVAIRLY